MTPIPITGDGFITEEVFLDTYKYANDTVEPSEFYKALWRIQENARWAALSRWYKIGSDKTVVRINELLSGTGLKIS